MSTLILRHPSILALSLSALAGVCLAHGEGEWALETESTSEACWAGKLERAEAAKAFSEDTGADLRNYPPDRIVDYEHMLLEMRFEDLNDKTFTAVETLRFKPIGRPAEAITLDAIDFDLHSVTLDGQTVEHYYDDEAITIRFDPPLPPDSSREIVIEYTVSEPQNGMVFTPDSEEMPEYTAEVHTHGQTETNSYWFACHDFPNEQLTTEVVMDVPSGLSASANGALVKHTDDGTRAVWHYLQDKPHVNYLVCIVIGTYDLVELPHPRVPMQVWVPKGLADQVEPTYGNTAEMIDVFEQLFGIAYPWARYDQILVKNFSAGGMENTSTTTMYPTAVYDDRALLDSDLDGLIAHELAHQWTGDMFTCKSWAHIWLNEGWATYGSALWFEHRDGEDGYLDSMAGSFRRVAWRDKTTNEQPMVSPVWTNSWETFRRAANPYPKGSSILHMLRKMLGDEVFFRGVALFMHRHAHDVVETSDFRYAMEEASGLGLEWFFEQWCYRPGIPNLEVAIEYDGRDRELTVDIAQTQQIDERTPAFRFVLPVYVRTDAGEHVFEIDVREAATSFNTILDGPPTIVAVDPWMHVLMTADVDKPLPMWIAQAKQGPTIRARHNAIRALADTDNSETLDLVATLVTDEAARHTLRRTAVSTLAKYGSEDARERLLAIAREGVEDARVRVEVVKALDGYELDEVGELLAETADTDESYATRVAAINALVKLETDAEDHLDLIVKLADYPSQHDQVRRAALTALAKLDDERGLDLAIQYAAYGNMDRARPAAISAIGKLSDHDVDRVVPLLIAMLDDDSRRAVWAAGDALADVGDERAVDPVKAMSESHPNTRTRDRAEGWLKKLQDKKKDRKADADE